MPDLLPSFGLQDFMDAASGALPHMEVLSHNDSITSGISVIPRDTILYNTFFGMAESFETSHDLDGAITQFSDELEEIAGHLFEIADAWKAAGDILASLTIGNPLGEGSNLIIIAGGSAVLVIGIVCVFWRRRR